jgi:hypothetical protein
MTAFRIDDIEFRKELQDVKVDEIIQKPILLEDFTSAAQIHFLAPRRDECFGPNFVNLWPRSFLLVFAFGIPIVLIAAPSAKKIVERTI